MKKSLLTLALLSTLSTAAFANQAGDILIRGGLTMVDPDGNKASLLDDLYTKGASLSVDDNTQLGLNFVYFFDSNWAIELLAATPFSHDVNLNDPTGALANALNPNPLDPLDLDGADLGNVKQLPPTLSALYYFDTESKLKPYVGVGINYTVFFDEKFNAAPKSLGLSNLKLDGSFGYAVQFGADYELDDNWSLNASIRYIDINTDATFDVGNDSIGKASIDIDPMVYSIMVGYKF
ncbi:MAG: outer membrane beta-barrel protein [Colwellia sp.]|nr:outer membrane beta-barrel protein [Colwellia sp.]